ncbi:hypothetical protein [Pseudomonas luteola]|uniref:hypothetical protein n=1 Tax=Pseudomonas luteola TaxID=47886 RepID=UPI0021AE245B|nr:hypothetical protein [Pseudomonas luteola]
MNRCQYFDNLHVQQFTDWLGGQLDSDLFQHTYRNRRSGKNWTCSSLYNAFETYYWPHPENKRLGYSKGHTPEENGHALAALRLSLQAGLHQEADMLEAALDVMRWGGVTAHNANWLKANQAGLADVLLKTRDALDAGDLTNALLLDAGLRFNAGMTKVYSLLCTDFIIYDSRVAAALGWIVVKYCEAHKLQTVPEALQFPWAAAKESGRGSAKRRDPSSGLLTFPRLRSGSHHALWNCKASWLLHAVLDHPKAKDSKFQKVGAPNDPLRALEAALFMIGYDLNCPPDCSSLSPAPMVDVLSVQAAL